MTFDEIYNETSHGTNVKLAPPQWQGAISEGLGIGYRF